MVPHKNQLMNCRQQKLQFRPPLEEIRAKYFREMKKFISIPNHFKGVGEVTENLIFPAIIDRNAAGFITCYKKADQIFSRLDELMLKFKVRASYLLILCLYHTFVMLKE